MATVTPERLVLLELLRSSNDAEAEARFRAAVAAVPDWPGLIDAARAENLLGLLARELDARRFETVPDDARADLHKAQVELARRGLLFGSALSRILTTLDRQGVTAVAFKGPLLSQRAYGDPGLRESVDIDVLLDRRQVSRAADALATIGYESDGPLADGHARALLATECELTLRHRSNPALEIHWKVLPGAVNRRLDAAAMLPRAHAVEIMSRSIRGPDDRDLLILLAAHGWKHGWLGLESICSTARVLATCDDGVVEDALRRAGELHFRRRLLLAVSLARSLGGVRPAAAVAAAVEADPEVVKRTREIVALHHSPERLTAARSASTGSRTGWQHDGLDTRGDVALARLQRLTWPSAADRSAVRLPSRLVWLYWVVRPARIAADAARRRLGRPRRRDVRTRPDDTRTVDDGRSALRGRDGG